MKQEKKLNRKKYELTSFSTFREALTQLGYSKKAIKIIYKWYDITGNKGIASY
jgi:hypothetical protein